MCQSRRWSNSKIFGDYQKSIQFIQLDQIGNFLDFLIVSKNNLVLLTAPKVQSLHDQDPGEVLVK